jgi:hypothetical protein
LDRQTEHELANRGYEREWSPLQKISARENSEVKIQSWWCLLSRAGETKSKTGPRELMSAGKNSVFTGVLCATGLTPDRARTGSDKKTSAGEEKTGRRAGTGTEVLGTRGDRKTSARNLIQAVHQPKLETKTDAMACGPRNRRRTKSVGG